MLLSENSQKVKIIAIEGIDGAGKSLQLKLLGEKLKATGKSVLELSFPDYDSFAGKEIGHMLSGKDEIRADVVDPKAMALWYAVDRLIALSNKDISKYDYLLLNRYTLSNAVYQGLRTDKLDKVEFLHWVLNLEHTELQLPKPHIYIILNIDEKISALNVDKKGFRKYIGNEPDVYEKSSYIIEEARSLYLKFAKEIKNTKIVNCMSDGEMLPPEAIHNMISEILDLNLDLYVKT